MLLQDLSVTAYQLQLSQQLPMRINNLISVMLPDRNKCWPAARISARITRAASETMPAESLKCLAD